MNHHYKIDDSLRTVEATTCYKIPKVTKCWLSVCSGDMPFLTKKAVLYTDDDLISSGAVSYLFRLPPNDKNATHIVVPKGSVRQYDRIKM